MTRVNFLQSITNIPMKDILHDSFDTLMAAYDLIGSFQTLFISGDLDNGCIMIKTTHNPDYVVNAIDNKVISKYGLSFAFAAQHIGNDFISINITKEG